MVCNQFGECSSRPDPTVKNTQLVTLTGSVGRNGRNLRDDVSQIQDALNRVGPSNGGPVIKLVVDGFVGPKTVRAIEDFQRTQFPGKFPDGRVDPGQRTVGRLNELLVAPPTFNDEMVPAFGGVPNFNNQIVPAFGNGFAPQGGQHGFVQASFVPPPVTTDAQMTLAERHAQDAEKRLTAAIKRMNQAVTAMGKKVRTAKEQELVREINWHFKANADPNPTQHMTKVSTVLATMLAAIKEHNLGTRTILRKGAPPPADPNAIAWAYLGGWTSNKMEEKFITITPMFMTQLSLVIVHELAHFCGGTKSSGKDIVHRASPDPFPTGTKREDGSTNYRDMPPFHARTNVYSYTVYCYPERPEFKVPATV
ncbi:MAG: peptidoglycan-binding protein [Pyrinomonadaceae bacterium]